MRRCPSYFGNYDLFGCDLGSQCLSSIGKVIHNQRALLLQWSRSLLCSMLCASRQSRGLGLGAGFCSPSITPPPFGTVCESTSEVYIRLGLDAPAARDARPPKLQKHASDHLHISAKQVYPLHAFIRWHSFTRLGFTPKRSTQHPKRLT
jgi:hypothetical protein